MAKLTANHVASPPTKFRYSHYVALDKLEAMLSRALLDAAKAINATATQDVRQPKAEPDQTELALLS